MVRITILVQLLLLFGVLKGSDGLQNEVSRLEDNRCLRYKHEILAMKVKLTAKQRDLDSNKELHKQMQAKIDAQTMSEEENKAIIKQLRERQKQLHENIEDLRCTENSNEQTIRRLRQKLQEKIDVEAKIGEENEQTVQALREKLKQLLDTIDNQTKIEETNIRKIQELRDKQNQLLDTIDNQTKRVEAMKPAVQLSCGKQEDACQYLINAARSGNVNNTKRKAHCNSESCTAEDGDSTLILAAKNGHVEVVRVLLEGGADVLRGNGIMKTALHRAAENGHLETCRLLLDWGAEVNTEEVWGKQTALFWAAWNGHFSVVKLLVERGTDVNLKNNWGRTAATTARVSGKTAVADWLDTVTGV